jgi:hypothetical protein
MKKRLLLQLLVVFCVVNGFAASVGDYLYSPTAKFKVTGENVVTNGTFADGTNGWLSDATTTLDGAVWGVELKAGPAGENVLKSITGAPTTTSGYAVTNVWSNLTPGIYAISYWIKSDATDLTSVTVGGSNYLDFFVNTTGSVVKDASARSVADVEGFTTEWKQITDTVQIQTGEFLVFNASKLATNTMITDFEIQSVDQVYDTRIAQRAINYYDTLLADANFTSGKDDFQGVVGYLKTALADPSQNESIESMTSLMTEAQSAFTTFLDANGASTIATVGDWSKQGYLNWNKMTKIGSYTFGGGRWGFSPNSGQLERPANDGYVATAGIQKGMDLFDKKVDVSNTNLKPGKYFFSIEAQATAVTSTNPKNTNWLYGTNPNVAIVGPKIYVGSDTLKMETDTISGYYWKTYYKIAEIKEGETVKAGFLFPNIAGKVGGRFSLRNPQLRMLGKTDVQLAWESAVLSVNTQQVELKNRLDTYLKDVDTLLWAKDSLQRAIDAATPIYTASIAKVTSATESTVAVTEAGVTELTALADELLAQVKAMGKAKAYVSNQNAIIATLKETIVAATAIMNDEKNAKADAAARTALQTAISAGQALLDNISTTNQYTEFQTAIDNIKAAQLVFQASTASFSNPSNIALDNQFFTAAGATGIKYSSAGAVPNWTISIGNSGKDWGTSTREGVEGYTLEMWRGYTVSPNGKCSRTVSLTDEGVYEYRAKAYATNDQWSSYMAIATITGTEAAPDTLYHPNIRLFFGLNGAPDSITVSKHYNIGKNGHYTVSPYVLTYVKTGTAAVDAELGLEGFANVDGAGACGFGFGDNRLYYCGSLTKYTADLKAALAAELPTATALATENASKESVGYLVVKLNRYITNAATASTLDDIANTLASIQELESMIGTINTGISTVQTKAEASKLAAKGIYSITGVKVADSAEGLNSLKSGLYIINGKKYMVK